MSKVYISAPITGYELNERVEYFGRVADRLRDAGYEAVNPMEGIEAFIARHLLDHNNREAEHADFMKRDIVLLLSCDAILLCPKWEESRGCMLEFNVARECGLKIRYLADGNRNIAKLYVGDEL